MFSYTYLPALFCFGRIRASVVLYNKGIYIYNIGFYGLLDIGHYKTGRVLVLYNNHIDNIYIYVINIIN